MDVAEMVRLDDQWAAIVLGILEPGESAVVGGFGKQFARALATDAQLVVLSPVAIARDMAELREHARIEPLQQFGAFRVRRSNALGVLQHGLLQFGPVGHSRAHIAQRRLERFLKLAAGLGVDACSFDVDHRFPERVVGITVGNRLELAFAVAFHRDDRMHEPVDRQTQRGDGRGDRIDEERHVVVDDRDTGQPAFVADALDRHCRPTARALARQFANELGGIRQPGLVEWRVPAQQRQPHAFGDGVLKLFRKRGSCRTHAGPLSWRRMIISAPRNIRVVCATTRLRA